MTEAASEATSCDSVTSPGDELPVLAGEQSPANSSNIAQRIAIGGSAHKHPSVEAVLDASCPDMALTLYHWRVSVAWR